MTIPEQQSTYFDFAKPLTPRSKLYAASSWGRFLLLLLLIISINNGNGCTSKSPATTAPSFSSTGSTLPVSNDITVSANNIQILAGQAEPFTAFYTDPNTQAVTDITSQVNWLISDTTIGHFLLEPLAAGLLQTLKGGSAMVTAEYNGFASNPLSITTIYPSTAGTLLITEVSDCYYSNVPCWVEVYNSSATPADLALYQLKTSGFNSDTSNWPYNITFPLPHLTIMPGSYARIAGNDNGTRANDISTVYIRNAQNYYPYWDGAADIAELIYNGATADYVEWGATPTALAPTSATGWSGANAPSYSTSAASAGSILGSSLARNAFNTDTNTAADWSAKTFATPLGPNDVTSNVDADLDGIPDSSEASGSTFAGLDLYAWGARAGVKDIFIEIDYMDSIDEGIIPRKEALDNVVALYAANGYTAHIDTGNLFDAPAGINPLLHDLGGGNRVPYSAFIDMSAPASSSNSFYNYKYKYMDLKRLPVFHYVLMADQDLAQASWGLGEVLGNDISITMGSSGLNSTSTFDLNQLINLQASTLFHELGHNLGLLHGGNDQINYKPNYVSTMNYLYTMGLPQMGTASEADRYYYENFSSSQPCGKTYSQVLNNPSTTTFVMNYSHGTNPAINETAVLETIGLSGTAGTGADYNCDGIISQTAYLRNLNPMGDNLSSSILNDFNDWAAVTLLFYQNASAQDINNPSTYAINLSSDNQVKAAEAPADFRLRDFTRRDRISRPKSFF